MSEAPRRTLGGVVHETTRRRDVVEQAEVIAQLSGAMDPFVLDALDKEVLQRRPHRVLDVGCGSGSHLAHLLRLLPGASGLGIESEAAAALARTTLASRGLSVRSRILEGDVRQVLDGLPDRFGSSTCCCARRGERWGCPRSTTCAISSAPPG